METISRVLIIGGSSLACAFAAAIASLETRLARLPPTDGASGMSIIEVWSDPFVSSTATIYSITGAFISFPFALWLLWRTNLWISIPVTSIATILAAALPSPNPLVSALLTLMVGLTTMIAFHLLNKIRNDAMLSDGTSAVGYSAVTKEE
jgi:hypothetical protein